MREAVRPGDIVAHFGGDEFVVLVREPDFPGSAEKLVETIQHALRKPLPRRGALLPRAPASESLRCRLMGIAQRSSWKSADIAGEASLKIRPTDGRAAETGRLKAKVGDLTMANEWNLFGWARA